MNRNLVNLPRAVPTSLRRDSGDDLPVTSHTAFRATSRSISRTTSRPTMRGTSRVSSLGASGGPSQSTIRLSKELMQLKSDVGRARGLRRSDSSLSFERYSARTERILKSTSSDIKIEDLDVPLRAVEDDDASNGIRTLPSALSMERMRASQYAKPFTKRP
jgi:hypothetical protein